MCSVQYESQAGQFPSSLQGQGGRFQCISLEIWCVGQNIKWTSDDDKMKHLPLFVDSDAFLLYDGLSDTDKADPDVVSDKLSSAFAVTKSQAYGLFVQRKLKPDESVGAYVADLQRLLGLSGHSATDDEDTVVIEQFINGLPV